MSTGPAAVLLVALLVCAVVSMRVVIRGVRQVRRRRAVFGAPPSTVGRAVRTTVAGSLRRVNRLGAICCGSVVGLVGGGLLAGPVAAIVLAAYGAVAGELLVRHRTRRAESVSYTAAIDAVAGVAADLRAGAQVGSALAVASSALDPSTLSGSDAVTVGRRVNAAVKAAETSGAPLADVLERLDQHLRGVDRARATVSAQAAGAQVSAVLLAAMPVAGVGLGYLLGVDPMPVLLRTRLGAGCLLGAVALQLAGLAWAGRLVRVAVSA